MNYDKLLIDLFWDKELNISTKLYRRFNQKTNHYKNIYNYLINRYNDSESMYESLIRLVYNIDKRLVCKTCGGYVKFIGKPNTKGIYCNYCCASCRQKDPKVRKKQNDVKLKKYDSINNINKILKTKLEKYGDTTFNNRDKTKITNIERYGYECSLCSDIVKEKGKQTKIEKYDDSNFNNRKKYLNTVKEKYGVEHVSKLNNIKEKIKQTKLDKYGDPNYNNIEKIKQTNLVKYNRLYGFDNNKAKKTKLERYGNENYNNRSQAELKRDYDKIIEHTNYKLILEKTLITKRKNGTFNKSNLEDQTYELLKEKYPDVTRQYKNDVYPFACDFYIPSLDLYIECNYHWTHGGHIYNENNEEDQKLVNKWKDKNTEYYNNAINTWTNLDVRKHNIAKENKLNYKIFYNLNEFKNWIK